jgi:hypothetical protein
MANYTIIGGDGKQYGPITGDDLRQWISEGRLNAQSLAKADSDAEFRTLATFPELADVFGIAGQVSNMPPPLGSAAVGGHAAALQRIKAPAVALMVASILNIILAVWSLMQLIFSTPDLQQINSQLAQLNNPQIEQFTQKVLHVMYGPLGIVNVLVELAISVLIFVGAKKMKSLQSYEFSLAAATLSMVPCLTPCCGYVLGLAFGIWALVVLRKPEVKSHFS